MRQCVGLRWRRMSLGAVCTDTGRGRRRGRGVRRCDHIDMRSENSGFGGDSPTGIMDNFFYDTADVSITFCEV